jgi:hypothetical protein
VALCPFVVTQASNATRSVRDEFSSRHAINLEGPGYEVFFSPFGNFERYVDFFLLQDMITPNGDIKFFLPFDDEFATPRCPSRFWDTRAVDSE